MTYLVQLDESIIPTKYIPQFNHSHATNTNQSINPSHPIRIPVCVGIDEAGRGPVLGPMVYTLAFCPATPQVAKHLRSIGVADSKALTDSKRQDIFQTFCSQLHNTSSNDNTAVPTGWITKALHPQYISNAMLAPKKYNLNSLSFDTAISMLRELLVIEKQSNLNGTQEHENHHSMSCSSPLSYDFTANTIHYSSMSSDFTANTITCAPIGFEVVAVYVDTVGDPKKYQAMLQQTFPSIPKIVVQCKADADFEVVGAASIIAKVTRDYALKHWSIQSDLTENSLFSNASIPSSLHSLPTAPLTPSVSPAISKGNDFGSGYPGDPVTVAWLKDHLDPLFGYPSIVRFSWSTCERLLEQHGHPVLWPMTEEEEEDNHSNGSKNGNSNGSKNGNRKYSSSSSSSANVNQGKRKANIFSNQRNCNPFGHLSLFGIEPSIL